MEILTATINLAKVVMSAVGAYYVVLGGYTWFEGYKSNNSSDQSAGGKQLVSGGGIILLAQTVIPMLGSLFTI